MTTHFSRYTSLPILLDILNRKRLTMLDPSSWDDKNDAYFLELYKSESELKTVLALCFTQVGETYHIWKVFAGDVNGVCIEFDKDLLLGFFEGMRSGRVEYKLKKQLDKKDSRDFAQLPFMKRRAFKDEEEFRIIYEDREKAMFSKNVNISLNCIKKIIFNPWIPEAIFSSVKLVINEIEGCNKIPVRRTDLVDSERWKKSGRKIAGLPDAFE